MPEMHIPTTYHFTKVAYQWKNGRCQYKLVITILHEWLASGKTFGLYAMIPLDHDGIERFMTLDQC